MDGNVAYVYPVENNVGKKIHTVTVVGANGTMGRNVSAIFASFGNARVYMVCRNIAKAEKARDLAYQSVRAESVKNNLIPVDYSSLSSCIAESELVFESSAENWDIKSSVTTEIADAASANIDQNRETVFCSGTSGRSITALAEFFPDELRRNYLGLHMFNPPYVMTLTEITPTKYTDRDVFNAVADYARDTLHRTVVEVKDSPAFLGNRIGFQFINEALQKAEEYKDNGGIDYVDAILGPFTGRNMPPLQTANFVGLDIHKEIVDNLYEKTDDFAHKDYVLPGFVQEMIDMGNLGRKTGSGLYHTYVHDSGVKIRQVYDLNKKTYRDVINYTFPFAEQMISSLKEGDYISAFEVIKTNQSPEARLACYMMLKYILYSLRATELVGYNIHSADDVMATGFNWCPPLAMIEAFGGVEEIRRLAMDRFYDDVLQRIDLDHLLTRVEPSRYDYRKFIRAKR